MEAPKQKLDRFRLFCELLEEFRDECPHYEDCVNSAMENHEPQHDEGRD